MPETREGKKSMTKYLKIEPVPDNVVELVCFTANEISKAKGHVITVKESEVRLILETVKMIYSIQKGKKEDV